MLLSEAQQDPEALKHHVFDIDEREEIQRLWQEIQQRNKTPPPTPTSKKPAGWSPDEDSLLIRLRNEGLRWEEIARRIEGHTPISCRLHYQLLEYESRQQDEKKNKLAVAYERYISFPNHPLLLPTKSVHPYVTTHRTCKMLRIHSLNRLRRDIWSPIAAELGDSWNEVETMSWALGQDEIRRRARAHQLLFSENDHSHDLISVKSTDGDWHEDRRPKATSYFQIPIRNSDDYRVHHFNLTMPPQLKSYKPANPALNANPTKSKRAGASLPSMEVESNPAAKLTIEGKRQVLLSPLLIPFILSLMLESRHKLQVTYCELEQCLRVTEKV